MLQARRARIDPTVLATLTLAAFRLTRLVTTDSLTEPWRERIFNRWPPSIERAGERWTGQRWVTRADGAARPEVHPVGRIVDCQWCCGVYCSAVVVALADRVVDLPLPLLMWPAVAALVGFLGAADRALA